MKLTVMRGSIRIIPESVQDEAYLENELGLRAEGDTASVKRVAPIGLSLEWAYAEACRATTPPPPKLDWVVIDAALGLFISELRRDQVELRDRATRAKDAIAPELERVWLATEARPQAPTSNDNATTTAPVGGAVEGS